MCAFYVSRPTVVLEKAGIEPAKTGLQGVWLIYYTTAVDYGVIERTDSSSRIFSVPTLYICFDKENFEPQHEISNNVVRVTSKASYQSAHTRSLIRAFASRLNILWILSY